MTDTHQQPRQITAEQVKKKLDQYPDTILLDVRTPEEYQRGKIAGSINLPLNDLKMTIESLLPDKDQLVYVYCLSGSRSDLAALMMQELGYSNVFSLQSGLLAWRSHQYPLS